METPVRLKFMKVTSGNRSINHESFSLDVIFQGNASEWFSIMLIYS